MLSTILNNENKIQKETNFVICPVCHGSGKNDLGFNCKNCGGLGLGAFYLNRFFYWGLNLNHPIIELRRSQTKMNLAVNLIIFGLGLVGIFALAIWIFEHIKTFNNYPDLYFWKEENILILLFWIGVVADMFIVFRISEDLRKTHKIKSYKYNEKNKLKEIPNNWKELKALPDKFKIDVSEGYSPESLRIVENAYLLGNKLNHKYILPAHLLAACLENREVAAVLARLNINSALLVDKLKRRFERIGDLSEKPELSNELKETLIEAYLQAISIGQKKVTSKNFLLPIMENDEIINEIFYELGIEKEKVYNTITWFAINQKLIDNYRLYKKKAKYKPSTHMDKAYTAVASPVLNQLGYDLTLAAKWGRLSFCIARDEEIEEIFEDFSSGKNGIVLVGPPGSGKRTVVNGIAELMVKEEVPKFLRDKRLVELDSSRLISGATPAEAEGKMVAIIDEVIRAGNIILFINNVQNLIGITTGQEESLDLASVLATSLEKHDFYCLASATEENYVKYVERTILGGVMVKVNINEPAGNKAIQMVESKIGAIEAKYNVYFSYDAIESVINFSKKYIHDRYLPEKAIDILKIVAAQVSEEKGKDAIISKEDIAKSISDIVKIPITQITQTERQKLINLEELMHNRVIGQDEAVDRVAASLRRARTEVRQGTRPIANFLFLGPTGVGKTELAKTAAEAYFGDDKNIIRVDMSEYQNKDSLKKMIGDPDGTIGYLTEAVRKSPYSLILLDEVEKAHPDILNLFLQVMDDGRLTDGQGRTIDFTNSIIIATSNAGAHFIQAKIKEGIETKKIAEELVENQLSQFMRPELINRFDGIIVFKPLTMDEVRKITKLMLKNIGKTLEPQGIKIKIDEEGVNKLAGLGFDPKFGARPLRRVLQEKVENEIANKILSGELKRRDTVYIDSNVNVSVVKASQL